MAAPVQEGEILANKYRVLGILGEGGMGVVVAAEDIALERKVAIKFLLPEYSQHAEACARFMREARAAVKIKSEHIARVIDVSTLESGSPYMVMEYLDGGDLSQVLAQQGPLPLENAVTYVLEACDAIAEAHACGIVHRDLKPANLFLARQPDGSSRVKVLDFGISKNTLAVADGTDPSLTRTSSMMGSPLYMSPEQMRSTKDVDARTDIWSLGIILYELLEGRLPFNANSIPELSAKILLEDPDPVSRTDVPQGLKQAIIKALCKDVDLRFPSVAEFAICLADYAPSRMRTTLERISRILVGAGMSSSALEFPTTLPPPALAGGALRTGSGTQPLVADSPQSSGGPSSEELNTVAGWGSSQEPGALSRRKWMIPVVALTALAVGVIGFVTLGSGDSVAVKDSAGVAVGAATPVLVAPSAESSNLKAVGSPAQNKDPGAKSGSGAEAVVPSAKTSAASVPSPDPAQANSGAAGGAAGGQVKLTNTSQAVKNTAKVGAAAATRKKARPPRQAKRRRHKSVAKKVKRKSFKDKFGGRK